MSAGKVRAQAAYVEDIDDQGEIQGERRTAKKVEIKRERPTNERRTSSRKEIEKPARDSRRAKVISPPSPPVKRVELKQTSREERRMSSSGMAERRSSSRPPSAHRNATFPQPIELPIRPILIQQQQPHIRAIVQQPGRPASFHDGMLYGAYPGPPISNSAYFMAPSNSLMPPPSYPPPNPAAGFLTYGNGSTYHPNNAGALPPDFRQDFFTGQPKRTLVERLGGTDIKTRRRSSVYSTGGYEDKGYESAYEPAYEKPLPLIRKSSLRRTQEQLDAERMPPPPPRRRGSVRYEDEDDLYKSRSRAHYPDERPPSRQRRPSNNRNSATYTYGSDARIELERNGEHRRRNSGVNFAPRTPSVPPTNYEDKFQAAEKYQTSVGGPQIRLTAESLKKASRRANPASSHSTRSSGSRDESERQRSSVTTRTTGTTGDEDITIKLKGQGTMKIHGVEIDYDKDTELNIRRNGNGGGGGSQRLSSDYGTSDDRMGSRGRASDHSRLSSHVRSSKERRYSQQMENNRI